MKTTRMRIALRGDGKSDGWLEQYCRHSDTTDLPLVHVTQAGAARDIIRGGDLEVRPCKVFTRDRLVYFFALRPDYKSQSDRAIDSQIDHFPAALIFSSKDLPVPHRIMPFDSGAAHAGFFDQALKTGASRHLRLEDYALLPDIRSVSAFIDHMFGSEEAYFRGELKNELKATAVEKGQGVQSYIAIASLPMERTNEPDMRASAIEVAYAQKISLAGNLRAVVLPHSFTEHVGPPNAQMRAKLEELGITPMTYQWQANVTPESRRGEMRDLIGTYFQLGGRFDR